MLKRVLCIFFFVQLVNIGICRAQADTPAKKIFNEWLSAFNSGDGGRLLSFWQKYGTGQSESHVSRDRGLHDMTGGFTVLNITQDSASHLVASMKDNHGGYAEITLEL